MTEVARVHALRVSESHWPHIQPGKQSLVNSMKIDKRLKGLAIRVVFSVALILASMRDYLLGNGLFLYRDWSWPLSTKVLPASNFSPGLITNLGHDPFGFTRIFITWPVLIIQGLSSDSITAEKVYVIYLYSIILVLAFVLGHLVLLLLNKYSSRQLLGARAEFFQMAFVLLCFTNFWAIENLSGFFYTYLIEFMLFAISFATIAYRNCDIQSVLVSGSILSVSVYLDPDLYLFGLIVTGVAVLSFTLSGSAVLRSLWKSILRICTVFVITLPSLVTVLYILSQTTGTSLRGPSEFLSHSTNITLDNVFRLLGYWWSTIMFAPPSVMWDHSLATQSSTIGSPPYLLAPSDIVTVLWLMATWSTPLVAAAALRLRTFRKMTIPLSLLALSSFHLTTTITIQLLSQILPRVSPASVVTNALSTVFGIPDHALILMALSYTLLCGVTIYSLLVARTNYNSLSSSRKPETGPATKRSFSRSAMTMLSVILVLFLLAFPSWQLFSGSFYPSGSIGTEGLSDVGGFSPTTPPPQMLQVYDWLLSQPNGFNVYWPGPNSYTYPWSQKSTPSFTIVDSPKPTFQSPKFGEELSYLISQNLTGDIAPYLMAMNVRYLVTQPMSSNGMMLAWGIPDLGSLQKILKNTPSIEMVLSRGDLSVFENTQPIGNIVPIETVYETNASEPTNPVLYSIFISMGKHVALVPPSSGGEQICIDQLACSTAVLTPGFVSRALDRGFTIDALNGSVSSPGSTMLQQGGKVKVPGWNLWSVNNWGPGTADVGFNDSSMRWTFEGNPALVSTSYNGTVTENNPGGIEVPSGTIPVLDVAFDYRTSAAFDSGMQISVPILDKNLQVLSVPISQYFPSSSSFSRATYQLVLPLGSAYFTARIQTQASNGWVEIRNIQMQIRLSRETPNAPFSSSVPLSGNQTLSLVGNVRLQYEGVGYTGSDKTVLKLAPSGQPSWTPEIESTGSLWLSGNLSISAIVLTQPHVLRSPGDIVTDDETNVGVTLQTSILVARSFSPGYTLTDGKRTFSSVATVEGLNLFENVMPGNYRFAFSSLALIQASYATTVAVSVILVVLSLGNVALIKTRMAQIEQWLRSLRHTIGRILKALRP